MAQQVFRDLSEEFLLCPLCKDRYKKPVMLPCLHSFCFYCLKRYKSEVQQNHLSCPACRRSVYLSNEGIEGLPENVFLISLVKKLKLVEKMTKESSSKCDFCRGDAGPLLCLDCQLHLCSTCEKVHDRIPGTGDHAIISTEKLTDEEHLKLVTSAQTPRCDKHAREKLQFYCTRCSQLVCRDCMIVSHQGHECVEAESKASSAKEKLEEFLKKSEEKVKTSIKLSEKLETTVKGLEAQATNMEKLVDLQYDACVTKLKSDREFLRRKIENVKSRKCQLIEKRIEEASNWLKAMQNTQDVTRRVLEGNTPWETLQMEKNLVRSFEKLKRDQDFSNLFGEDEDSSDEDDEDNDSSGYDNDSNPYDDEDSDEDKARDKDDDIGVKFIPSNIKPSESVCKMLDRGAPDIGASDPDWRNKNHIGKIVLNKAKTSAKKRSDSARCTSNYYEPLRFRNSSSNLYESM